MPVPVLWANRHFGSVQPPVVLFLLTHVYFSLLPPAPRAPSLPAPHVYFWAGNHLEGKGAYQEEKFIPTSGKALLATQ